MTIVASNGNTDLPRPGRRPSMLGRPLAVLAFGLAWSTAAAAEGLPPGEARVTPLYAHALPHVPGKSLTAVLVEYGPGGGSPPHTHAASAFIAATVLEGAIRSQVNDAPPRVYQAGESFSEMPGDHHRVSENASATAPARLIAVFVVDAAEAVLTIPDRP